MNFAIVTKHGITFGNPKRNSTILIPVWTVQKPDPLFFIPRECAVKNIKRFTCVAGLIVSSVLIGPSFSASKDLAFVIPAGQLHLFLDDREITKLENLKRTMHKPDLKIYKTWCTVPHDALLATAAEIKGRDHQVVP